MQLNLSTNSNLSRTDKDRINTIYHYFHKTLHKKKKLNLENSISFLKKKLIITREKKIESKKVKSYICRYSKPTISQEKIYKNKKKPLFFTFYKYFFIESRQEIYFNSVTIEYYWRLLNISNSNIANKNNIKTKQLFSSKLISTSIGQNIYLYTDIMLLYINNVKKVESITRNYISNVKKNYFFLLDCFFNIQNSYMIMITFPCIFYIFCYLTRMNWLLCWVSQLNRNN